MKDRKITGDDPAGGHVEELLSGYLDGELTQQQRQQVDLHLSGCETCRRNMVDLDDLRQRIGRSRLSPSGEDIWRETMDDPGVNVTRGIGWLLFIGALLVITGLGIYEFIIDSSIETIWKVLASALYLGLAALFVSVLRQRLIERKSDRYKDVEI
jgi:hypothetical protein